MSVYKLAATGVGGVQDGIAQLDVQFDGIITAIHMTVTARLADAEEANIEVSFISTNTIGSNDTRGSLFIMRQQANTSDTGWALHEGRSAGIAGLAIVVNAGERLWMHMVVDDGKVAKADAFIYVEDGQAIPVSSRRR